MSKLFAILLLLNICYVNIINAYEYRVLPSADLSFSKGGDVNYSKISIQASILQDDLTIGAAGSSFPFVNKDCIRNTRLFLESELGKIEIGNNSSSFYMMQPSWRNIFSDKISSSSPVQFSYYSPRRYDLQFGASYIEEIRGIDFAVNYDTMVNSVDCKIGATCTLVDKKFSWFVGLLSSYGPYVGSISYGPLDTDLKVYGFSPSIGYLQGPLSIFFAIDKGETLFSINSGISYKVSKYLSPYLQVTVLEDEKEKSTTIIAGLDISM